MVKVSVFIGTSVDGFIAREDGDIGWLDEANKMAPPGEDFGFNGFLGSVDLIIMGRKTFEQVITFDRWSYKETRMIVLTSKNIPIPKKLEKTVTTYDVPSPKQLINELSHQSVDHVYIDGGIVIQDFLSAGLVDEITVTIVPILIGKGKSFSGLLAKDLFLQHLKTTVYDFGFVQNKYKVNKKEL
ncbi:MAG: dihydrofolate reductase family protein [Thermoproteota archaeon]|nr:dihydrofolate reductase family protein [Thermoproteota archaeon]